MPRGLIIAPAPLVPGLNALSKAQFDPEGGEDTLSAGLVPVGSPAGTEPTHYWAAAQFSPGKWALLQQIAPQFPQVIVREYNLRKQPNYPNEVLGELGLQRPVIEMP